MHVLVTGGAGYIGSHAVVRLLEAGHEVTVVDNLSTGHRSAAPRDRLIECDIADTDTLAALMRGRRVEAVMHFAASCLVPESVQEPAKYYENNISGTLRLLAAMRRAGVQLIVFSSTCATYGLPSRVPIAEDERQEPINPYGFSKLAIERALREYSAAYGLGAVALRYFNAAGADPAGRLGEDHDPETHLIPIVLQVALGQRPCVKIYGTDYPTRDGTCIRDYIHVLDLAEAHRLALERLEPGRFDAFNLGSGRGYSVREVIEVARRITGKQIEAVESDRRPGDPPELVAAANRVRRELGWSPNYSDLDYIIETAWQWHSTHPRGYQDSSRNR